MSAAEPVIPQQQQQTDLCTLSDSFTSSAGSDLGLLGDLMIDLGSTEQQQQPPQQQQQSVKMPATESSVTSADSLAALAPKSEPGADKGLKMKIKRKSKHEEKHEIVAAETLSPVREDTAADSAGPNAKKARVDKADNCKKKSSTSTQARRDASVNTATVGTSVEPDHLGPCDPGTNISLDGIVWLETATGLLVVNVTWRGRTYVGTLLDSSQHEFAPPCPKDYVPPMETSARNARGRGKRRPAPGCGAASGGSSVSNGSGGGSASRGSRRLGRQLPLSSRGGSDESDEGSRQDGKEDASAKSDSPTAELPREQQQQSGEEAQSPDQPHIKCPELGCDKRFSQLQALKWHTIRNHAELRPLPPSLANNTDLLQTEQLREMKSLDGSSVFKVPQQQAAAPAAAKTSPPKTVTVSKTCPVPTAAAGSQAKSVKKDDKIAPPAQGPFKPIQPKPELLEGTVGEAAVPLVNGEATVKNKKRQRRSPERPPALAPKTLATSASGTGSSQRAKFSRRSDPVSPAYSDISDEGSAPLLEKEEPPVSPPPPPPPPAPVPLVPQSTAQPLTSLTSSAPQSKTSVAAPPAAIVPPLPQQQQPARPRVPASPAVSAKPVAAAAHATPRGSPNAPQKPSLGHSPSEDSAKQAEERRQILAENSDIREQQQHQLKEPLRTPQLHSPSSCRPSSRQSVPPPPISAAAYMGALTQQPHPMAPPPPPPPPPQSQAMPPFPTGPGGFPDYRLLAGRGFPDCGQFLPPFLPDKAALEALAFARSPFMLQQHMQQQQQQQQQQHKIHELAAGSVSPGPGKTPPANGLPPHHQPPPPPQQQQQQVQPPHMSPLPPHSLGPFHRAGLAEPFMMPPPPPFSIPSPLMPQPHFLPHK